MISPNLGIDIGSFNTKLLIQECKATTDANGFRVDSWETVKQTRGTALYYPRYLRENFENSGTISTQYKVFTFRYYKDINAKQRIVYRGTIYEVVGFNDLMDSQRFTQVYAREICL